MKHEEKVFALWSNYQRVQDFCWTEFSDLWSPRLLKLLINCSHMSGRADDTPEFHREVGQRKEKIKARLRAASFQRGADFPLEEEMQERIAGRSAQRAKTGLFGLGLLLSEIRVEGSDDAFLERYDLEDQPNMLMPMGILNQPLKIRIRVCGSMIKILWTYYLQIRKEMPLKNNGTQQLKLL